MVLAADIPGLRIWADVAGVLLLLELCVLLLIVTALVFALAFGARWLYAHVIPVLNLAVPKAKQAMDIANQGNDQVVRGIAKVYGFHQAVDTAVRVLLRGRDGARPVPQVPLTEPAASAAPAERAASEAIVFGGSEHDGARPIHRRTTAHAE
ncbi:MAG TPA: hypothetical protein VGN32_17390 [Ktedonobacterales bacterium]|jgi:hypothetical protein|nr:hypothetical protein [Ktedonobacterales bacterium]